MKKGFTPMYAGYFIDEEGRVRNLLQQINIEDVVVEKSVLMPSKRIPKSVKNIPAQTRHPNLFKEVKLLINP